MSGWPVPAGDGAGGASQRRATERVGTSRVVFPGPFGEDDWPALFEELRKQAGVGPVIMAAGDWNCKSAEVFPSYGHLIMSGPRGVRIACSLTDESPTNFVNCPFVNNGNRPDDPTATLTADSRLRADRKTITIDLADEDDPIEVGDVILVRHGTAWWNQREVVGIEGDVYTLDKRLVNPFDTGDTVVKVPEAPHHITIEGNGAVVSGTGTAVCQFATGRHINVYDLIAEGHEMAFTYVFDVASRDCNFHRCHADCGFVTPGAFLLAFNVENSWLYDCSSTQCSVENVYFGGVTNCGSRDGWHADSEDHCALLDIDDPGNTYGNRGVIIDGTEFIGAASSAVAIEVGTGIQLIGVDTSDSQTGVAFHRRARNCVMIGGTSRGCSAVAVSNAGMRNRVIGHTVEDFDVGAYSCSSTGTGAITVNVDAAAKTFTRTTGSFITDGFSDGSVIKTRGFSNAGNNGTWVVEDVSATVLTLSNAYGLVNESGNGNEQVDMLAELSLEGCTITDTSTEVSTGVGHIAIDGIGALINVVGVRSSAVRNAQHFIRCSNSGQVKVSGETRFHGYGTNNFGVMVDAAGGVADISQFTVVAAGGYGLWGNGAGAVFRIGDRVDLSACGNAVHLETGAESNRGTFAVNGTTPVAVAFTDTKATDRITITRKTAGGTPGHVAVGAPSVGVGFSVVGQASDTSTFEYVIG